ncbi:MAG: bifunctional pantoate--beta-alanine ligase/(d)CMP kinase [Cyanobacteriota bacterium]
MGWEDFFWPSSTPLQLLRTQSELLAWRQSLPINGLHFVPTMGALHAGHLRLIQQAAAPRWWGQPRVLVSVFLNPLQFAPGEDLERYPRRLPEDAALAAQAGAHALFSPSPEEMFPNGEAELTHLVPPASLLAGLCAVQRPGHFEGVATIVIRLLALIRPERMFLGEKDWQQVRILRQVVTDLGLPVQIQTMATLRDADGLALSSRNGYLSEEERRRASALPACLAAAGDGVQDGGAPVAVVLAGLEACLRNHNLVPEYVSLVDGSTLRPLERLEGIALLATAVRCGSTRLIDHLFLMQRAPIIAIDGPAGAGKSTVTRSLARRLGLTFLDTGAMYRALCWWILHQGVDPGDSLAVAPLLEGLDLDLQQTSQGQPRILVNGHDVTTAIRGPEVTAVVSTVAAHPCVRHCLTALQQRLGERGGLVAEGRDTGTAVFPDAECKIFLTASVAERARRRAEDLRQQGHAVPDLAELEGQIAQRDAQDSNRSLAPLQQAPDALVLVTDGMGIDAVIEALVDAFRSKVPEEAWPGAPQDSGGGSLPSG